MPETDLRFIVVREKTVQDPNFEVRIVSAATLQSLNGVKASPRLVVVAAVADVVEYGTAFRFSGLKKLVLIANNIGPGGDGVIVHAHLEPGQQTGPANVLEHGFLLGGSFGGTALSQEEADDATIGALAVAQVKVPVTQEELDEAQDVLTQHLDIPRNPAAVHGVAENTISWDASPQAGKYNVYFNTDVNVTRETGTKIADGITATTFTHTGLNPGSTYYYVVTAVRTVGTPSGPVETESVESVEVSATPT